MQYILRSLRVFLLLGCIICTASLKAATSEELISLEAEMLRYVDSDNREAFTRASENLKTASLKEDDERMFFKAWGYQAIYEASHQYLQKARDIAREMTEYARKEGSIYGEYAALHTEAMILLQTQDKDAAEKAFLKAYAFRHSHFPNESAAEDLRELIKIANFRGDIAKAKEIGNQLLAEPNVAPHQKGRTLYRLCIIAFNENNVEDFNRLYNEMKRLERTDGIKSINLYMELNYQIINGDFKRALLLVDRLAVDTCAERKALIYHRLGDDDKAYDYMVLYKHISDSIDRVSHNRELSDMYLRMNNDRLRLEEELLEHRNSYLQYRLYAAVAIILILILLFIVYERHKFVRMLTRDIRLLNHRNQDAESTLKNLHELSYYESRKELSLNMPVKINKLCDHLASVTQKNCHKGVVIIFQTDLSDDFVLLTNSDALEKIFNYLIYNSSRFTQEGMIWLKCVDAEGVIRFSITDTCRETGNFIDEDDIIRNINMSLNFCQSICRLLHGHFWHDEAYIDGARFIFEIPKRTVTDNKKTTDS